MAEIIVRSKADSKPKSADIPDHIAYGAARITYNAAVRYFADPAVMADYQKWLKKQKNKETE